MNYCSPKHLTIYSSSIDFSVVLQRDTTDELEDNKHQVTCSVKFKAHSYMYDHICRWSNYKGVWSSINWPTKSSMGTRDNWQVPGNEHCSSSYSLPYIILTSTIIIPAAYTKQQAGTCIQYIFPRVHIETESVRTHFSGVSMRARRITRILFRCLRTLYLQEEELQEMTEQLHKSEGMRRRLNDQVTELQGQLAIEEQRSRFCTIL